MPTWKDYVKLGLINTAIRAYMREYKCSYVASFYIVHIEALMLKEKMPNA